MNPACFLCEKRLYNGFDFVWFYYMSQEKWYKERIKRYVYVAELSSFFNLDSFTGLQDKIMAHYPLPYILHLVDDGLEV